MQLHLLGTTGYHPSDARQTACLMLPELGIVLDAGTAMYRVRDHLATDTLDIYLTHAHLDHCVGLTYLFDVLNGREMERVTVHGEAAKLTAIQEHLLSEYLFPVAIPCEWMALPSGDAPLSGGGRLSHFPLQHPGGSVGYRLDWPDRSIAYVTDTTAAAESDYVAKIHGVDVLVHECNFEDERPEKAELTGHSCLTPVCEVAAAAEVGLLVLVHINPIADEDQPIDLDHAKAIFPNTVVSEDRMVVEI
jgi:ribonuclease BN (tRNA processing enzyme)